MRKLNKRAFTLIELLAVILILGIIALIAIPTVTNIIEDSKTQSYIRSAEGLLSSVDTKINIDMLKGEDINVAYNFKNGKLLNGELDLKGTMPEEGKVRVNNDGEVKFAIVYNNYCLTKSFDSDEITASELDENGCQIPGIKKNKKFYGRYNSTANTWSNLEEVYYVPEYRNNIASISFLYQKEVPSNALISWDVSASQDESIMAYLMSNGDKYDLYIISEGNIYITEYTNIMFRDFTAVESINFNNFYISNFVYAQFMFQNCTSLKYLDLSIFDTSKVISMASIFDACSSLKDVNLSSFDTSEMTELRSIFSRCSSLEELDLSNFNTSKVKNYSNLFSGCTNLKKLNVSSFDTSIAKNMESTFRGLKNLEVLDISNFDTRNVTDMQAMFYDSTGIKTIYIGNNWKTAANNTNMLSCCGTSTLTLK